MVSQNQRIVILYLKMQYLYVTNRAYLGDLINLDEIL